MPRADLLSLSPDDLATLANRGLVKRALAELDGGQISYTLSENAAGTVSVLWSDDVHCLLPSGAPLQNGKCSCSATGLCRHLIRSVLAYGREHSTKNEGDSTTVEESQNQSDAAESDAAESDAAESDAAESDAAEVAPVSMWNPGEISEETLEKEVPAPTLNRARKLWDAGQVIEVSVGAKPGARFHTLGVHLRFMVRGDARYTHCDCAEPAPCVHVPLAVRAFRDLAPEAAHGLISTQTARVPVPGALLGALETALGELAFGGVAGAGRPFLDKLSRLERECRAGGLVWPAGIVADLARQIELHAAHNARFEPARVAQLTGELLMRSDAIRSQSGATPDVFVRGAASDIMTEVGAARLIGIGTGARTHRGGVTLSAWMQDTDSGALVFVSRDFPDPQSDSGHAPLRGGVAPAPQPFWKLAATPVVKGVGIGALGSGQVLARGGKRAPDGEFSFGRTPLSFNLQSFEWEKLRAPLLCEGFAPIEAHLDGAAPTALRPRRAGEDVFVVPIAGVEEARFHSAHQEVRATLRDASGAPALLIHPYTARGASGVEALLAALSDSSSVRFIAGRFSRGGEGLKVSPLALIRENGAARSMIQPWVSQPSSSDFQLASETAQAPAPDALRDFGARLEEALGELWLVGLGRSDERVARDWAQIASHGAGVGFGRLMALIDKLSGELERKSKVRQWDSLEATKALFEVAIIASLCGEIA